MATARKLLLLVWLGVTLLSGCGGRTPTSGAGNEVDLASVLPGTASIPGWRTTGDVETYDSETLFDLVDGQADAFFAYNFQQVAVQSYENAEGTGLRIEIWELSGPADAYGLFTRNRAGEPAAIGNDSDTDPGRRLSFWQSRYFVQVRSLKPVPDDAITSFGTALSKALPAGGTRPALVIRLPSDNQAVGSLIFFYREISIQDEIWLGGENILGLGPETAGALARYELPGSPILLAVTYPSGDEAEAAMGRLREAKIAELADIRVQGTLLGAVFGETSPEVAGTLLKALFE